MPLFGLVSSHPLPSSSSSDSSSSSPTSSSLPFSPSSSRPHPHQHQHHHRSRRLSLRRSPSSSNTFSIRKRGQAPSSSTLIQPDLSDPTSEPTTLSLSPEDSPTSLSKTITNTTDDTVTTCSPDDASDFRPVSRDIAHSRSSSDPSSLASNPSPHNRPESVARRRQKEVTRRIHWSINLAFENVAGPPQHLTAISARRVQPTQIAIPRRDPSTVTRPRTWSAASSTPSGRYSTSSDDSAPSPASSPASGKSPADNRPFSGRARFSLHNLERPRPAEPDPSLFTVSEEASSSRPTTSGFDHSLFTQAPQADHEEREDEGGDSEDDQDMGLARSLTKRFQRADSLLKRDSPRKQRPDISLPIALLSTTNELGGARYEHTGRARGNSDSSSGDGPSAPSTPMSEAPDLTDTSSVGSSRSSADSPTRLYSFVEPNHLTRFFEDAENKSLATVQVVPASPDGADRSSAPPAIPRRAASHSKREHVRLARARSVRTSAGLSPDATHPFGNELAQLREVQEDFNSMMVEDDSEADELWISSAGYRRLTPSAYVDVIADIEASRFAEAY